MKILLVMAIVGVGILVGGIMWWIDRTEDYPRDDHIQEDTEEWEQHQDVPIGSPHER